jgi:hypothetical protein
LTIIVFHLFALQLHPARAGMLIPMILEALAPDLEWGLLFFTHFDATPP